MKKIISITIFVFMFTASLHAVKSGSYKVKQAPVSARIGSGFGQGLSQGIADAMQRQRELDQYKMMLEMEYEARLNAQIQLEKRNAKKLKALVNETNTHKNS